MSRMKAVLDTNIIVGAYMGSRVCYKLLERFKMGHFDLFYNSELFGEYKKKLEEFLRTEKITDSAQVNNDLHEIQRRGYAVALPRQPIQFPTNDPDDRCMFKIAALTQIDYIVSRNQKDVNAFDGDPVLNGARIINPEDFLTIVNS